MDQINLEHIITIRDRLVAVEQLLEGTKGYWTGVAADAHREIYAEQKPEIDAMIERLSEMIDASKPAEAEQAHALPLDLFD